MTFNEVDTMIY